ncbi:MAG: hypothetical protein AB7O97_04695 [Planctomycetota bacterium]
MAETAEPDPTRSAQDPISRSALDPARAELLELLERLFGPGSQAVDDGTVEPPTPDDAGHLVSDRAGIGGIALLP